MVMFNNLNSHPLNKDERKSELLRLKERIEDKILEKVDRAEAQRATRKSKRKK